MKKLSELTPEEKKIACIALDHLADQEDLTGTVKSFKKQHNLEPFEIEVGKWIKCIDPEMPKGIIQYIVEKENDIYHTYGFDSEGQYKNEDHWCITDQFIEATEEEVFEALKNEAIKRGFVKGVKYLSPKRKRKDGTSSGGNECIVDEYHYKQYANEIVLLSGGRALFSNGKWAEIIDNKPEIKDQIKRLEEELETLKKMI